MSDKSYCVYMHTSPSNKVYIGITCQKPKVRWGKNGSNYKGQPFYNAIKKYGWNNIEHDILFDNLTESEAKELEILLIKEYRSCENDYGYNVTKGGDGGVGHIAPNRKTIYHYSDEGELIEVFSSIDEADKLSNYGHTAISRWINNLDITPHDKGVWSDKKLSEESILNIVLNRYDEFLFANKKNNYNQNIYRINKYGDILDVYKDIYDVCGKYGYNKNSIVMSMCRKNFFNEYLWCVQNELHNAKEIIRYNLFKPKVAAKLIPVIALYDDDTIYQYFNSATEVKEYFPNVRVDIITELCKYGKNKRSIHHCGLKWIYDPYYLELLNLEVDSGKLIEKRDVT